MNKIDSYHTKYPALFPALIFGVIIFIVSLIAGMHHSVNAQGSPPSPLGASVDSTEFTQGTDTSLLKSYRVDSSEGLFMNGDIDLNDNDLLNATVLVSSILGDANWFGNQVLWGHFIKVNEEIIYDIRDAYAVPKNADTFLQIPCFIWIDIDGLGDTVLWAKDSSCALHTWENYSEAGWNGYRYQMIHTPVPSFGSPEDSAQFENPTFVVSNNGIDYSPMIDSFSPSPTYDSLTEPIVKLADYDNSFGGAATFLADPVGHMDTDSTLWNLNKVGFASNRNALVMQYTQDGLNWTHHNGADTFIVIDTTLANGYIYLSPKLIRTTENGSPKYYIYIIQNHYIGGNTDSTWLVRYESDYICSSYVFDNDFNGAYAQMHFPAEKLWHMDMLQPGNSDLILLGAFVDSGTGGTIVEGYTRIGHSADMGVTWDWGDSLRIIDTTGLASTAWDAKYPYKVGGHLIKRGQSFGISLLYCARGDDWRFQTGRTEIWFRDTTTQIDSTGIQSDGVSWSNIDWPFEWLGFREPGLAYEGAPDDSTKLTFGGINSIGSYIALNVAGDISPTDIDTFTFVMDIPYPCTIDSIKYNYRENGAGKIDSIALDGPDISVGHNLCDSTYYSDATDRTGSTQSVALDITDITVIAGQRYEIVFVMSFAADNDSIFINWAQLGVQR